ncbi:MAG: TRAP transporter large permease subunit, partial [Desulfobacterales bacterium]|nr:TRAP transporter large permease subunit [Desulfobacterales bacterium]
MTKPAITVASIAALLMVAYHMVSSQVLLVGSVKHLMIHLGSAVIVVYFFSLQDAKTRFTRIRSVVLLLLSVIIITYYLINEYDLMQRKFHNPVYEQVMGVIFLLLVLEAAREAFGIVLPLVTVIFAFYPIVGSFLPEPFHTTLMPPEYLIGFMTLSLDAGLWSTLLPISLTSIYPFVVFAGLLQGTGAVNFFMQLGHLVGSRIRGGPGLMSVVASSAVGSLTGSVGANIALTGSFTIPLMKRAGYAPHQAAAIESAASSAGVVTPPVMGATAFLMSGLTGIPYIRIIAMAIIPALIYYIGAASYVYLRAAKLKLKVIGESPDIKELLISAPTFLVPLLLIVVLLLMGKSILYTAFWAIISVMVMTFIRKKTRPSVRQYIQAIAMGCRNGAGIACTVALTGLIFDMFTMSGT